MFFVCFHIIFFLLSYTFPQPHTIEPECSPSSYPTPDLFHHSLIVSPQITYRITFPPYIPTVYFLSHQSLSSEEKYSYEEFKTFFINNALGVNLTKCFGKYDHFDEDEQCWNQDFTDEGDGVRLKYEECSYWFAERDYDGIEGDEFINNFFVNYYQVNGSDDVIGVSREIVFHLFSESYLICEQNGKYDIALFVFKEINSEQVLIIEINHQKHVIDIDMEYIGNYTIRKNSSVLSVVEIDVSSLDMENLNDTDFHFKLKIIEDSSTSPLLHDFYVNVKESQTVSSISTSTASQYIHNFTGLAESVIVSNSEKVVFKVQFSFNNDEDSIKYVSIEDLYVFLQTEDLSKSHYFYPPSNLTCTNCDKLIIESGFKEYEIEFVLEISENIEDGIYFYFYSFEIMLYGNQSSYEGMIKCNGNFKNTQSQVKKPPQPGGPDGDDDDGGNQTPEGVNWPTVFIITGIAFIGTSVSLTTASVLILKKTCQNKQKYSAIKAHAPNNHQYDVKMIESNKPENMIPLLYGKYVITRKNNYFQVLDLSYKFMHKNIKLEEESQRDFMNLLKGCRASKYSSYSHCKYCFKEQSDFNENANILSNGNSGGNDYCCKCGLPLIKYVTFEKHEMFCVVCALMNKYDHNNHGRCVLHVSNLGKTIGATYSLYKTSFSVSSASKKKKKSPALDRLKEITEQKIWRMNSYMRFEFLYLLRNIIGKELFFPLVDEDGINSLRFTLREIRNRKKCIENDSNFMVSCQSSMKFDFGQDISDDLRKEFIDNFLTLLDQTIDVICRNLKIIMILRRKQYNNGAMVGEKRKFNHEESSMMPRKRYKLFSGESIPIGKSSRNSSETNSPNTDSFGNNLTPSPPSPNGSIDNNNNLIDEVFDENIVGGLGRTSLDMFDDDFYNNNMGPMFDDLDDEIIKFGGNPDKSEYKQFENMNDFGFNDDPNNFNVEDFIESYSNISDEMILNFDNL